MLIADGWYAILSVIWCPLKNGEVEEENLLQKVTGIGVLSYVMF